MHFVSDLHYSFLWLVNRFDGALVVNISSSYYFHSYSQILVNSNLLYYYLTLIISLCHSCSQLQAVYFMNY